MEKLTEEQTAYLGIIEANPSEVISPFLQMMHTLCAHFMPTEVQVAHMIRSGKTSKKIPALLHISKGTVDAHRNNIRGKLDLNDKDVNLRTFLGSI